MSNPQDITLVIKVITDSTPVDRLNAAVQRMQKNTGGLAGGMNRLSRTLSPVNNHFAGLSEKLNTAERKMDAVFRAGVHLQSMGRDLMGVGRDIAGFAQNIVQTYAKYDFTLRQAALALNTNVEWTGKLDKAIQNTAITLGKFKPEEVAAAYRVWGAATGEVIDSEAKLARITKTVSDIMITTAMVGGSLESNLQGVYGVTQQYSLGLEKAGYVTKVMALLTERTALNFGDLASAFVYAGSYTGAIGVKFEDVAQALGIMADAGFRGSKAGRGLSMFFEAITAPSGPAKKALDGLAKSMGAISWKKFVFPKGKFQGMRDLISKMAAGLEKMTPLQRAAFLAQAGSNNAVRAALPLIKQQIALWDKQRAAGEKLTSILDETKYSLKDADLFFQNMTKSFLESFDSVIGSFGNSFFPLIQLIAIQIMKFAGPIMGALSAKMKDLAAWMEKNPAFVEVAVKIGAIAAIVLVLAGAFLTALGTMAFFYANIILLGAGLVPLVSMFAGLALVFGGVAIKFGIDAGGISTAIGELVKAFERVFKIMTSGKSGSTILDEVAAGANNLVNSGIAFVADAITRIADALNMLTPEQIKTIQSIATGLLSLVIVSRGLGFLAGVIGTITSAIIGLSGATKLLGVIRTVAMPLIGGFMAMAGVVLRVAAAFLTLIGGMTPIGWVILAISAAIAAFVLAYQNNFMGFRDFVDGLITWFMTELPIAIGQAMTAIGAVVGAILSPIVERLPAIVSFLQGIATTLAATWVPIFEQLGAVAGTVIGNIVAAFQDIVANVTPHIQPLVDAIMMLVSALVDFLGPAWNAILTIIGGVMGLVVKYIMTGIEYLAPYIKGFLDVLMRIFGIAFEFVGRVIGNFVTFFLDAIKGVVNLVTGIIEIFTGILTGNWDKVWKGLGHIIEGFASFFGSLIRGVITLVQDIIRAGLQIVTGIFEFIFGMAPGSILSGIGKFITDVVRNFTNLASSIVGAITGLPGKMLDIGKNIVEGLWNGIKSMANWIENKMWDFIKSVIPGPVLEALGIHSPSRVMAAIGAQIVEGLALGITSTSSAYDAMLAQANAIAGVTADMASGSFNVAPLRMSASSDATQTINLNVDVTSADGSVNQMDMNTLAGLINGSDMARSLERMASVD